VIERFYERKIDPKNWIYREGTANNGSQVKGVTSDRRSEVSGTAKSGKYEQKVDMRHV